MASEKTQIFRISLAFSRWFSTPFWHILFFDETLSCTISNSASSHDNKIDSPNRLQISSILTKRLRHLFQANLLRQKLIVSQFDLRFSDLFFFLTSYYFSLLQYMCGEPIFSWLAQCERQRERREKNLSVQYTLFTIQFQGK